MDIQPAEENDVSEFEDTRSIATMFSLHPGLGFYPREQHEDPPSLFKLASKKAGEGIADLGDTDLPGYLMVTLLREALMSSNSSLVINLLSVWPRRELALCKIFFYKLCLTRRLYDKRFREELDATFVKIISNALDCFSKCINAETLRCLRVLDISGMTNSRDVEDKAIQHTTSLNNLYLTRQRDEQSKQDSYTIQANASLDSPIKSPTWEPGIEGLDVWTKREGLVDLQACCLDFHMDDGMVESVVNFLNTTELAEMKVFRYGYTFLGYFVCDACIDCATPCAIELFASSLEKMESLTHFGTSEIYCEQHGGHHARSLIVEKLGVCLAHTEKLRCLDLTYAPVCNNLETVIGKLQPITVLILRYVPRKDLKYLAECVNLPKLSQLCLEVEETDLSVFAELLKRAVCLKVLQVASDGYSEEKLIYAVSGPLAQLEHLQAVIFTKDRVEKPDCLMSADFLQVCCLPTLEFLALPLPIQNLPINQDHTELGFWYRQESERFLEVFHAHVAAARNRLGLSRCYLCVGNCDDLSGAPK